MHASQLSPSSIYYLIISLVLILSSCGGGGDSAPVAPPPSGNGNSVPLNFLPGPRPVFGPRNYVLFESGQVRPLALSEDQNWLYATNTPDNRLEIYAVEDAGLEHRFSVPVGLEPVALAVSPSGNVWVVNHLSDSVSIVDTHLAVPQVVTTLLVGDEPQDIVFAGNHHQKAFITTAHRGQNSPVDPGLTTAGIGRADVWVFDSTNTGEQLGGKALTIITLFGDKPRGLAASPDGSKVYASIFKSGNQTTSIAPANIAKAPPLTDIDGVAQPDSGVILKFNGNSWIDDRGVSFNQSVPFSLPDFDLFEINASLTIPIESKRWSGIGTSLFNIRVHPDNGKVYVSNLDANNHIRFAGQGANSTTVNGRLADNRITIVDGDEVLPRRLNKHLNFSVPQGTESERKLSLSMPLGMQFNNQGKQLYVTAYGSQKVAVYDAEKLDDDSFSAEQVKHIELSAGGPSGIVLSESINRAFVMTRFDNGISSIDLTTHEEVGHWQMFNPEPPSVVEGRRFQFDARLTSGKGNDSCASCHLFSDNDGLAWDLGDPGASIKANPNAFINISPPAQPNQFHSMKGPMTTQSMRGIVGHGPMHWRGDRTGENRVGGETLEEAAFKEFNEAFVGLLGRDSQLTDQQMQQFTDYAMELTYPPNPIRALDNQLNEEETAGLNIFNTGVVRVQTGQLEVCRQCHTLNPAQGIFGTSGLSADNSQAGERNVKIPHFRDQYQKVGNFGWGFQTAPTVGPQVKGFGYNHNGATSGNFVIADLGMPAADLAQIRAFLFAFPTEQAPIVGQQVTLTSTNQQVVNSRIELLVARAKVTSPVPECDLIVKTLIDGSARGFLMNDAGLFVSDKANDEAVSLTQLKAIVSSPGQSMTFTCTPWGSGQRMGIDRDMDTILDGDDSQIR